MVLVFLLILIIAIALAFFYKTQESEKPVPDEPVSEMIMKVPINSSDKTIHKL
jgi:hypothetical protein